MGTQSSTRSLAKDSRSRWHSASPHGYLLNVDLQDFASSMKVGGSRTLDASVVPNDVSSRFGRRLRELRRERDLTQTDMARKFGIDRSFISDVERGRKSISLPTLEVMAIGLNLTLADLFSEL